MRARFRYALDPVCLAACAAYATNRFVLKPHTESMFVQGQLSDLLLIPCALPIMLWIQRWLGLRIHDRVPDASEVFLHLIVWAITAELFAPLFFAVTADPRDVIAYVAGAVFSWAWWNRAESQSESG